MVALTELMAVDGYIATPVAGILRRAGVSRETFYEQFRSKEDCFEQGFIWAMGCTDRAVRNAAEAVHHDDPRDRMDVIFGAYLQDIVDNPARAKVFLVDVFAAGPRFAKMRVARHMSFADSLTAMFGAENEQQRFACEMLVAAISAMVTATVAAGDFEGVLALRRPFMDMIRRSGDLYGTTFGGSEGVVSP